MDFTKITWNNETVEDFLKYFESYGKPEKVEWTRKIINTKMPLLATPAPDVKKIVKEISKGDIEAYLKLELFNYYELTVVYSCLIMELKDFDKISYYLEILIKITDNWATCDRIPFKKAKKFFEKELFNLAQKYIKSPLTFQRRIGIIILFEYLEDEEYIEAIFQILNGFYEEKEYYVNMANAWLFSYLFIKQREKTLAFLENHQLNKSTINKGIQKCRDSFRVTKEDKEMLLQYKVK